MDTFEEKHLLMRQRLAHPEPEDEINITGIAGQFPNSHNFVEFGENIMNKLNLCDDDERRGKHTILEVPKVTGKLYDIGSFDAGFFGIHAFHAHAKDPMQRLILERTYEAILDAGISPEDLIGSKTGVYVANCGYDSQTQFIFHNSKEGNQIILGFLTAFLAQNISYHFKLNGPSMALDSACSGGIYALDAAYLALKDGKCDRAIVGGVNLIFNPKHTLEFFRLGVLNKNGKSCPFDDDASGYTRAEGIFVLILEKSKTAKRIYAKVVHSKTNSDGFKPEGITFPSKEMQINILKDIYAESGVPLDKVGYFEAHGTGTVVGDLIELASIDNFFNTEERKGNPLNMGTVKANIGHAEPLAGLNSIAKVVYGMENDVLLPQINFTNPRKEADGFREGRLKVITEVTPWPEDAPYSSINSFGFGGANSHLILKRNEISKEFKQTDGLPRLVCFSGRTKECVKHIQESLNDSEIDTDQIRLLHSAFRKRIANNVYRGYSVLSHTENHKHSSRYCIEEPKNLEICIGEIVKIDINTFQELNKLPVFKQSVTRFIEILRRNHLEINFFSNALTELEEFMYNISIQFGIVDVLISLGLVTTCITGYSFGHFVAAYAKNTLNLEEIVTSLYKLRKLLLNKHFSRKEFQGIYAKSLEENKNSYKFENIVYNILKSSSKQNVKQGIEIYVDNDEKIQLLTNNLKLEDLLQKFGRLYECGFELDLLELYPKYQWPVPRGTPTISQLVKWEHNKEYLVPKFIFDDQKCFGGQRVVEYNIKDSRNSYLRGHVIDGRNLFPATGYIMCVAEVLSTFFTNVALEEMIIQFANLRFRKATTFTNNNVILLNVSINKTGNFEISENGEAIVTGQIILLKDEIKFDIPKYVEKDLKLVSADVYKELRLRGYNYSGPFYGIRELCGNRAIVDWSNNFVVLLDNLIQLFVLQEDSRCLYVPTGIAKLTINMPGHIRQVKSLDKDQGLEIYSDPTVNVLKTEFIEIVGIEVTAIPRKKQTLEPILEIYKFVPNEFQLSLEDALSVNTQIILETRTEFTIKVLENITEIREPMAPIVEKVLDGQPFVIHDIKIISCLDIRFRKVNVVRENMQQQFNNTLYIGSNILAEPKKMEMVFETLVDDGFIITLESSNFTIPENIICMTKYKVSAGTLLLLSKPITAFPSEAIRISSTDFKWLNVLKNNLYTKKEIIIYSENDVDSGILGFTKCLRFETRKKCFAFFLDGAPAFDVNSEFYKNQLNKRFCINVYKNGQWGTYRHLPLDSTNHAQTEYCFANVKQPGDLNSLMWISGTLDGNRNDFVDIYYSPINFKDLMTASGKLSVSATTKNRLEQECVLGIEYSGITNSGERVMGIVKSGAIASKIKVDPDLTWFVPQNWSLQEGATVPSVYLTVLFALKMRVNIKEGQSILIHSGTGGIGLAAINVALHYGLVVFTTVGTEAKRRFLMKHYPQLDPLNIGNSRNSSFEEMICKRTQGRGVDYVLNSLAEEKLLASVRCLGKNGTFLEIGKFDISRNSELEAEFQNKGKSFTGVMLDTIIGTDNKIKRKIQKIVQHGIEAGFVQPLPINCFEMNQLQEAFRYIGKGKHIGKVIIKIRDENAKNPRNQVFSAVPRVYFNPDASYLIIGGLGGFGLEFVDWMVVRGARKIFISSRKGIVNGYQMYTLRKLLSYGASVEILKEDINLLSGCRNVIKATNAISPLEGIFNLAVDYRDAAFDNLTENDFKLSLAPKAVTTKLLDEVSRDLCPNLKYFIAFSSTSCGRGNLCQTNYGMANSIMERISERRKSDGLPTLIIQWGAVGDVGQVVTMQKDAHEIVVAGTLQQKLTSCLDVLDRLFQSREAVVSSMIVAEKTKKKNSVYVVDAVLNVIGIRELRSVSPYSTLPEVGMDSMMAVEIKNILENDFDLFLTPNDIKALTIHKLNELQEMVSGKSIGQ